MGKIQQVELNAMPELPRTVRLADEIAAAKDEIKTLRDDANTKRDILIAEMEEKGETRVRLSSGETWRLTAKKKLEREKPE